MSRYITYILQVECPEQLVKIGRTSNLKSRLNTLRTGLPWPARVVALIGNDIERDLKTRFAEHRVQGEWFRPTLEMRAWLTQAASEGLLARQVTVDQAYINAVIKPRVREYLNGREPENNSGGDLVRCLFADLLPSIKGREQSIVTATKGHVTLALCRGLGPTNEVPHLEIPEIVAPSSTEKAA